MRESVWKCKRVNSEIDFCTECADLRAVGAKVALHTRACCREVKFSKTLAWVIFWCLFMCRIDIYLSWKKLIMFSWGEISLKIWPVLKGKWLKIGLNRAYFKNGLLLIQTWKTRKTNVYSTIFGGSWREKVVSVFGFRRSKSHFWAPKNGHLCRKCPF